MRSIAMRSAQRDTVAQSRRAAELRRLDEALVEHAAVGLDDSLRREILRVGRDLDVRQPFLLRGGQELAQGRGRVAASLLPRNDRVADVAQAVRRQRVSPGLPAQVDET